MYLSYISKVTTRIVCIYFLLFSECYSATQGTLGATSTGSVNISITKSYQADITDLTDMTYGAWNISNGAVTLTSNVCVYSSTGSYTVAATGSGTSGAFTLGSGGNTVAYSVTWNSGGAGSLANTGAVLTASAASSTLNNASTTSANCSGGGSSNDTARVIVGITLTNMQNAVTSTTAYTGTLTMIITPI